MDRRLRKVDAAPADVFLRKQLQLLENRRPVGDDHIAVRAGEGTACSAVLFEDVDADSDLGVGIVVDLDLLHVGLALVPVQPLHLVLLAQVHVDGMLGRASY